MNTKIYIYKKGMGIFYTEHRLKPDAFFGGETTWNGLAVIFDTLNLDKNVIQLFFFIC